MFLLITNCEDISLVEILDKYKYKYQPWLEKRHEQLKTETANHQLLPGYCLSLTTSNFIGYGPIIHWYKPSGANSWINRLK